MTEDFFYEFRDTLYDIEGYLAGREFIEGRDGEAADLLERLAEDLAEFETIVEDEEWLDNSDEV